MMKVKVKAAPCDPSKFYGWNASAFLVTDNAKDLDIMGAWGRTEKEARRRLLKRLEMLAKASDIAMARLRVEVRP